MSTPVNRPVLPITDAEASSAASPAIDMRDQDPPYPIRQPVRPPGGAPNVLVVVIDDMGFGASSAFGGECRMPTAERLAENGLRYTRFHTAAVCAPTRAALLTGRNPHSCSMGGIPEMATSAPGYTGVRPPSVATIARILSGNGYATGAFGKMHQTPAWEVSHVGPFERWPTGDGFQRFYGFLGAETDHFAPADLIDGVTRVDPPRTADEGYHFSEDIADQAISWIESINAVDPDRPWFCYLSYGACHAPLHVPESWRDRYRGQFAHGWDAYRERTLAHQQELGVVPDGAQLGPWPDDVPHWDALTDTQRIVVERLMELYAAFAEHADAQTGRLVEALRRSGQLENTLVLYLLGDNGASAEGGLDGTWNEALVVNGHQDTAERIHDRLDELGGPDTYPQYPVGWALAMNTPYQWTKQVASHYGGTRNGLVVSWPKGITRTGELRHQWHHAIDVVPTILEVAGLPEPSVVDGAAQQPVEGTSFRYTFDDPDAPERHTTQYFEAFGNRGIYHHGWTAVTKHRTPWQLGVLDLPPFSEDRWELYDTTTDWTQSVDLADTYPEKLAALQQRFLVEAARYQVLPLDDRLTERFNPALAGRPDLLAGRRSVTLKPNTPRLRENVAPNVKNTSFLVTVVLDVPPDGADGVLVAQGGRFGGWSLYVRDGHPCYCHNLCGIERTYVRGRSVLEPGRRTAELRFSYDGGGLGRGGAAAILVDGEECGAGRLSRTTAFVFAQDETMDVGVDRGTPVTDEYAAGPANAYPGLIEGVRIDVLEAGSPAGTVPST